MVNDGANGAPRGRGPPLPHISDVTATPRDIDKNLSLKRLLDMCESSLRSAEMSREFKRPATALKDYIRSSIIAVHVVKEHRDHPTMQQDQGGALHRRHNALLKQISALYDTYEELTEYIRQDNAITKVQPIGTRPASSAIAVNGNAPPARASEDTLRSHGYVSPAVNGASSKTKPVLKPKPQSLHGNALANHQRTPSAPNGPVDALTARFASLRGPQASPGQDPRIKTHSFAPPPRPLGPREMPSTQKPQIGIDSSVSALPKMPDAIYSPVRGNMSQESASLPTSTPRGFSRTGSGTSNAGTPSAHQPPSKDYFSPIIANSMSAEPSSLSRPSIDTVSAVSTPRVSVDMAHQASRTETIEADALYRIMKTASSVLIIDVRSREEYDEGHIMSSSTMCIEPEILTREDLSADQIQQSLVLHDEEQHLFEKRHEFGLVVFYDENSKTVPRTPQDPTTYALMSLQRALVHLSFDCTLKQPPKLLAGGLEAWIDLMGSNSLRSLSKSVPSLSKSRTPGITTLRSVNSPKYQLSPIHRRTSKYRVQALRPDDARAWQETLNNEDNEAISPSFHKTTEDFFRRFPEVSIEPEDMAPIRNRRLHDELPSKPYERRAQSNHREPAVGIEQLASPPRRPAPAVPRPSHSGLTEGAYHEVGADGQAITASQTSVAADCRAKIPAGLHNPGNWCYNNSVLQAILATRFGRLLAEGKWRDDRRVPMMEKETIENPRLVMSMVHSVFNHMHGPFDTISPELLMRFAHDLCTKADTGEIFGDQLQHDASEYFGFLLAHMDDESNLRRHLSDREEVRPPNAAGMSPLQFAADYWKKCHRVKHQSLIDEHFLHLDMQIIQCQRCDNKTFAAAPMQVLNVHFPEFAKSLSLTEALNHTFVNQTLSDYQCDNCSAKTNALIRKVHPYMPDILCMSFARFQANFRGGVSKNEKAITWDLNDFDMSPWFLQPDECQWHPEPNAITDKDQRVEKLPKAFAGKFHYETVAVVQHSGRTAGSGHYTAHVRDDTAHDRNAWLLCNDTRVTKTRMDTEAQRRKLYKDGARTPYLVIFQRKMSF